MRDEAPSLDLYMYGLLENRHIYAPDRLNIIELFSNIQIDDGFIYD